jgi:hypothetical protein
MDLPGPESEDLDLYQKGYLPVPYPVCWFEVEGSDGGETMCYLLEEIDSTRLKVVPFRFVKVEHQEIVQFTGEEWVIHKTEAAKPTIELFDPFMGAALWYSLNGLGQDTAVKGETGLIIYLLLMLVSKTSEINAVEAPAKLNKARAKKDKPPIPPHRVVSIIPRNIAKAMRADGLNAGAGRVRASPRLHWRRSHLRHVGEKVIVIARQLVGYKALDGREFVTHEYHVKL